MRKYKFNEFEKYIKKDHIYLIFYLVLFIISIAVIILNAITLVFNSNSYTSIIFIIIFSLIALFIVYLLINYLLIPNEVLTLDYEKETLTLNNRLLKPITINLSDILDIQIISEKTFFNVMSLGCIYFVTKEKTYRAKYLKSPKYLLTVLSIYVADSKEGKNNVK